MALKAQEDSRPFEKQTSGLLGYSLFCYTTQPKETITLSEIH